MKPITFATLAVVTAAVAGGAWYATLQRDATITDPWQRQPLYPGLVERVNDATSVRIASQADGTITMTRNGDIWTVAERHGYPADFNKLREALVELASIETLEPKTNKPENYTSLKVEDVDIPQGSISDSIRFTAKAGDTVLADLLIGRVRPKDIGEGVFVRKHGDTQAWLGTGTFQPNRRVLQWLNRNAVNIDSRRIQQVTLTHPDGDTFTVDRPDLGAEDMAYASPMPEGKEPKPLHEMNNMASVTDFLIFEEVRPTSEITWTADPVVSSYRTYDGMTLTLTAVEQDGQTWVKAAAAASPRAEGIDAFVEAEKGKDSVAGRIADQFKTPAEIVAEVEVLAERLAPWAYRLTDYKSGKVRQRSAEMLQIIGKKN
jgi:hypothetical protein